MIFVRSDKSTSTLTLQLSVKNSDSNPCRAKSRTFYIRTHNPHKILILVTTLLQKVMQKRCNISDLRSASFPLRFYFQLFKVSPKIQKLANVAEGVQPLRNRNPSRRLHKNYWGNIPKGNSMAATVNRYLDKIF